MFSWYEIPSKIVFVKMENMGFPIIFTIFYENYFDGISYHGISPWSDIPSKNIFIKNGENDKRNSHFSFSQSQEMCKLLSPSM